MSFEKYCIDLVVGVDDFKECNCKSILSSDAVREGYPSMWIVFYSAAQKAKDDGCEKSSKVLWLLADVCSMMLSPQSQNEPFKPMMIMGGKRLAIPDDFTEQDILFFSHIIDEIDDIWLKGRIADLVWLRNRDLGFKFALLAIDSYCMIPLETETLMHGGRECWERAMSLTLMLKKGGLERLVKMEALILEALKIEIKGNGFLPLCLADFLAALNLRRKHGILIAEKLETVACEFDLAGNLLAAREYFHASAEWFSAAKNQEKSVESTLCEAECYVKEAVSRLASSQPSHMVAASFYESAIQTLRTIPANQRTIHRVNERIDELRKCLNESGERSLGEMGHFSTSSLDISEIVENARNKVRNKSAMEGLKAFTNLHQGAKAKEIRENAIKMLKQHPFHAMFAADIISRDGRVIAKRPGMSLGDVPSEDDEITIRAQMVRNYGMLVGIIVQGDILPALEVLLLEHRLHELDFVRLAQHSPVVPSGRERLFGKALFAGYDRDFVTALHLLVPQIEHMVRCHLKASGAKTTNLDSNGIENENGLSTLMDMPETVKVFSVDLAFEIKTLFCDPFGPNFRNELAHGLIGYDDCQTPYAIYAWWLGLRLVFNTFWNAAHQKN